MNNSITVIDVRTPAEFQGGHVANSINIPLQELDVRMDEIRNLNSKIILCCASGARSSVAQLFLNDAGITSENGGSWFDVNYVGTPGQ